jgi:hypothetical protein
MNLSDSLPGPYLTELSPDQEKLFRQWVTENNVPYDINQPAYSPGNSDYDMRGWWLGMINGDPHATSGIDPYDGKLHFTDYWKTPWHKLFSRESKYATQNAPYWEDNRYLKNNLGNILFDAAKEK